MEVSNY